MSNAIRAKAISEVTKEAQASDELELSEWVTNLQNSPEYAEISAREDAAQLVFEAMEARGMSRADLARCIGKSRSYVTKLLSGEENISVGNLEKILRALGLRLRLKSEEADGNAGVWLPAQRVKAQLKCLSGGGSNLPWHRVTAPKIEMVNIEHLSGEIQL